MISNSCLYSSVESIKTAYVLLGEFVVLHKYGEEVVPPPPLSLVTAFKQFNSCTINSFHERKTNKININVHHDWNYKKAQLNTL